jgi:molecular chaperone GrpE
MFSNDASKDAQAAGAEAEAKSDGAEGDANEQQQQAAPAGPTPEEVIADLKKQLADKHEHMLMAYANEENALRISKMDVAKARDYAVTSFAKSLLDVADNLERARVSVPASALEGDDDKTKTLRNLVEGVKMTEDGLLKAFQSNGVVRYGKVGDVFNANIHEALYMYVRVVASASSVVLARVWPFTFRAGNIRLLPSLARSRVRPHA